MRWGVIVLSLLGACGRIGFDPSGGTGGDDAASGDGGNGDGGTIVEDDCIEPGLVLYLAFDETDGTLAVDSSGNAHAGTLVGFDATTRLVGRKGKALRFDGVDDRIDLGSPAGLDDIRPLTACAWIKSEGVPAMYGTIIDKSLDGFSEGWNFYLRTNGSMGIFVHTDAYIEGGNVPTGAWHHVCATWDNTPNSPGLDLYRDGSRASADAAGGGTMFSSDAPHAMTIGGSSSGMYPFQGLMDELRIYDHALDGAAVDDITTCSAPPPDPS